MDKCYICAEYWKEDSNIINNKCDRCYFDYTGIESKEIKEHPHFIIKKLRKDFEFMMNQIEKFINRET